MEISKVREFGDAELRDEVRKAGEQLFRIRFQLKLGQNEGVKRLVQLKKDVARFKTVERERMLGIRGATSGAQAGAGSPASIAKRRAT
jgi:large subunit ribosomal protein L29